MQQESRVKKSLLNARVNLIFYFLTLALSFFSRKIFLDCLGADFIGLTGTLGNLLGFLNLAELGIGTTIGYVLYKPLYEQDKIKINDVISVLGYLYHWIGIIILVAGCVLACFFPWIYPDTKFDFYIIYFAYFSFLASSLLGYFINYRQCLLGADQKNYVVAGYFQSVNILKTIIQMLLAYYSGNYYLWIIVELSFGILHSIILNWKIDQVYPWLKTTVKNGRELYTAYPEIIKYTKQMFVHRLGGFVQFQLNPFLIYAFVSLQTVAYYGNYTIITQKVDALINSFLGGTYASVGNLIAEGDNRKILKVYWELMCLRIWVAGAVVYTFYFQLPDFIALWLGSEYIMSSSVLVIISISFFLNLVRGTTDQFIFGYGLFYDIWSPLVESLIFVVVALIGGYYYGLEGVLCGGITSMILVIFIWKPYFLFKCGFKLSVNKYWLECIKYLLIISCVFYISSLIHSNYLKTMLSESNSWVSWILNSSIVFILSATLLFLFLYITNVGMRDFTKRCLTLFFYK